MAETVSVWIAPLYKGQELPRETQLSRRCLDVDPAPVPQPEGGIPRLRRTVDVEWHRSPDNATEPLIDAIGYAASQTGPIERIERLDSQGRPIKVQPHRPLGMSVPVDDLVLNRIRLARATGGS